MMMTSESTSSREACCADVATRFTRASSSMTQVMIFRESQSTSVTCETASMSRDQTYYPREIRQSRLSNGSLSRRLHLADRVNDDQSSLLASGLLARFASCLHKSLQL
ncbi:hypothetical protein J6590_007168 [Homalodisca vitripennis]|nr:hypothetical protein J6590_007168 [Homalodisca vitripennis]